MCTVLTLFSPLLLNSSHYAHSLSTPGLIINYISTHAYVGTRLYKDNLLSLLNAVHVHVFRNGLLGLDDTSGDISLEKIDCLSLTNH